MTRTGRQRDDLLALAEQTAPWMMRLRQQLHQIPEPAFAEHQTAAMLAGELAGLGLTVRNGVGGTGIVAELDTGRPGRCVAIRASDALLSNLRGDVPEKLGLTYKHLKAHNPALVCAHLSAYGRDGPRASWPGFDYLMQAETGWFSLTGDPDQPPTRFGLSVVDQMTGVALGYAALCGIIRARASGEGGDIDVSLFDVALSNLGYPAIWYLNAGHVQERLARSAHPSLTPCQLYKTADGWIYLMCNKEKFWPALCDALGHAEWAGDPRFETFEERFENRPLIQDMLDQALSANTTAEWLADFAGIVPAAPINDVGEALENPFVKDEGRLQDIELDGHGTYRYLRPPVRTETPAPARPAPKLGEHTEALLAEIGYDAAKVKKLKDAKVI